VGFILDEWAARRHKPRFVLTKGHSEYVASL
jgi:hypothetical protein